MNPDTFMERLFCDRAFLAATEAVRVRDAMRAARATLQTLLECLPGPTAQCLRRKLPLALVAVFASPADHAADHAADPGADLATATTTATAAGNRTWRGFVRRVAEREAVSVCVAGEHVRAVFAALRAALPPGMNTEMMGVEIHSGSPLPPVRWGAGGATTRKL